MEVIVIVAVVQILKTFVSALNNSDKDEGELKAMILGHRSISSRLIWIQTWPLDV